MTESESVYSPLTRLELLGEIDRVLPELGSLIAEHHRYLEPIYGADFPSTPGRQVAEIGHVGYGSVFAHFLQDLLRVDPEAGPDPRSIQVAAEILEAMLASPDERLLDVASTTVLAFIAGRSDLRLDLLEQCAGPLVVSELR